MSKQTNQQILLNKSEVYEEFSEKTGLCPLVGGKWSNVFVNWLRSRNINWDKTRNMFYRIEKIGVKQNE